MLLVIVGAGASYDCSTVGSELRPHLAKDLFDNRPLNRDAMNSFNVVRPLVAELQPLIAQGATSVEEELARVTKEAESNPARKRQLMAMRFYLNQITGSASNYALHNDGGVTKYVSFINRLQQWQNGREEPICIVNFNYDLLLEQALKDSGINWEILNVNNYTDREDFMLIKPHGSIDWVRWVRNPNGGGSETMIRDAPSIYLERSDIHLIQEGLPSGFTPVPALAVPVSGKYSFECLDSMLENLKRVLPGVDRVLTVGWRGAEEHFKPILSGIKAADLLVVTESEKSSEQVLANLSYLTTKTKAGFQGGFANFVHDEVFEKFLS